MNCIGNAGEKLSSSERRPRSGVRNTCAGMVSVATVWNGETVSSQRGAASWTGMPSARTCTARAKLTPSRESRVSIAALR